MVIPSLARLGVPLASAATVVAVALVPGTASAQTQACGNTPGTAASFCTGLHTAQATARYLSVNAASPVAGSPLIAVAKAFSRRQDFQVVTVATGVFTIRWAPRGVISNMCATQTGGVNSRVRLAVCNGSPAQDWSAVANSAGGFNVVNVLSGLALTQAPAGTTQVQVRGFTTGTSLNKRWDTSPCAGFAGCPV